MITNFMNRTIPDPAEPIGNVTIVDDFLPPPEQLLPKKIFLSIVTKKLAFRKFFVNSKRLMSEF
jgi:hypothetical protein